MQPSKLINSIFELQPGTMHRYLEIGCAGNRTFRAVRCHEKVGVDPRKGGTLRMTSDAYFAMYWERFDVVFIDGLHEASQVYRDIMNSLTRLKGTWGIVLVHDCYPRSKDHQLNPAEFRKRFGGLPTMGKPWCGDVWKAVLRMKAQDWPDLRLLNVRHGFAAIRPRRNTERVEISDDTCLDWNFYRPTGEKLLNPLPLDDFMDFCR